jgi:hypothetical protein
MIMLHLSGQLWAQNEIGPEGKKIAWLLAVLFPVILYFIISQSRWFKKGSLRATNHRGKVRITLEKDRRFYPDFLTLTIKNIGKNDVDLDRPLLTFENYPMRRNFRIKGSNRHSFYPLYLDSGRTHTLEIELVRFYQYDRKLKRYPRVIVTVFDVKNRRLGKKSLYLRKTLFHNA